MFLTDERRDAFLPLSETGMPAGAVKRMEALGITTLEELRDTWTYGNRQLLADYLGESPVRFTMCRPSAALSRGPAASGPGDSINLMAAGPNRALVKHPRGLSSLDGPAQAAGQGTRADRPGWPAGSKAPVSEAVTLIDRFPAVRDQAQRSTCVAFASVAYLEFHLSDGAPRTKRHSEQFLYWACKEVDGIPSDDGTTLAAARKALKKEGVCLNATWKYQPMPIGPTEGQGPPPAKAVSEAKKTRWSTAKDHAPGDVKSLSAQLDQGQPIVLGVLTFPNWDFPSVADTGEINLPVPLSQPDGGHAVCVVGYELRPNAPGGGVFVFRNSWSPKWAPKSRYRGGYGTMFFDYVRLYAVEAYC